VINQHIKDFQIHRMTAENKFENVMLAFRQSH